MLSSIKIYVSAAGYALEHVRSAASRLKMKNKNWYDYLWLWSIIYFALGFFNILFAWLGMIDFILPLLFAIFGGNKFFCNRLCGRGQLFAMLPKKFKKCSRGKLAPKWISSSWFQYGFLIFFMAMFCNVLYQTWRVYGGVSSLREVVTLFWTVKPHTTKVACFQLF